MGKDELYSILADVGIHSSHVDMALAYASNGTIISGTIFGARRASKAGHQLTSTGAGMLHGGLPIKMQQNNLNKKKKH